MVLLPSPSVIFVMHREHSQLFRTFTALLMHTT